MATARGAPFAPEMRRCPSVVTLLRQDADGTHATSVQVRLGRSSVSQVEVVEGLTVGDTVILSDMSAWDAFDRIRLQ
jgi:hypothetical protein